MKTKLPDFLVVGAAKAGTTSLYHYLKEHGEIYLCETRKELKFFSAMEGKFRGPGDENVNLSITGSLDDYLKFFSDSKAGHVKGDISPDYLYYYANSIRNIKAVVPTARIIIVLRNPIDRAFSHWMHFVRDGRERLSFTAALKAEAERMRAGWEWAWFYKDVGLYYRQVKAYLENFDQVRIYLFDELKQDTPGVVQDIFRFIGVDDTFIPAGIAERFNVSGVPRSRLMQRLLARNNAARRTLRPAARLFIPDLELRKKIVRKLYRKNLKKEPLPREAREYLKNFYKEDILLLQGLIGRDLSSWLK